MQTIITAQSGLLQVKIKSSKRDIPVGAKRSFIKKFTRASRKRMLDNFARMRLTRWHKMVFITLTYGDNYPDEMTAKEHLWAFIARCKRRAPRHSGVWRLEAQQRGASHFHLLLVNFPFWDKDELSQAWTDIIGIEYASNFEHEGRPFIFDVQSEIPAGMVNDYAFTNIELVRGKKMAMNYVSKYVAKMAVSEDTPVSDSGFNDVAYLDAPAPIDAPASSSPGRFWGKINADKIPYGKKFVYECETQPKDFYRWQFAAALHYPQLGKRPVDAKFTIRNKAEPQPGELHLKEQGFSLYVTSAEKWMKNFMVKRLELLDT